MRLDYEKIAPATLKGFLDNNSYFDDCSVDQILRRLVELRVSQVNNCSYCIWLHKKQATSLGETKARIDSVADWWQSKVFSEVERAAFEWAELVTGINAGAPIDEEFAAIQEHFSEVQVVELTAIISNMNALNRMAVSFGHKAPN